MSVIDDYLATIDEDQRKTLADLRATIRQVVPDAEECISYRMPAFRLEGRIVAGFQATARGCSYYPFSGSTLRTLAADVAKYSQTKSALHFHPEKPLPKTLVRKLIAARMAETQERPEATKAKAKAKAKKPPSRGAK